MSKALHDILTNEVISEVSDVVRCTSQGTAYAVSANTFANLEQYNDIDSLKCIFGANTTINYQFSFVLIPTNYTKAYHKDNKHGGVNFIEDWRSKAVLLAMRGFKVSAKANKVVVISPRYQKLCAISKLMDTLNDYFNYEYIAVNRYDNKELLSSYNMNHCDIIKECQLKDRHFSFKWVTDRANKYFN